MVLESEVKGRAGEKVMKNGGRRGKGGEVRQDVGKQG